MARPPWYDRPAAVVAATIFGTGLIVSISGRSRPRPLPVFWSYQAPPGQHDPSFVHRNVSRQWEEDLPFLRTTSSTRGEGEYRHVTSARTEFVLNPAAVALLPMALVAVAVGVMVERRLGQCVGTARPGTPVAHAGEAAVGL